MSTSISTSPATLCLDEFAGLFKDAASFQQFAAILTAGAGAGKVLLAGDRMVGGLVPSDVVAERFRAAVLNKLLKDPATVETLIQRLESDDLVD